MISQMQVKEGIDAVIVDSVLAIRKGLTGESPDSGRPDSLVPGKQKPTESTVQRLETVAEQGARPDIQRSQSYEPKVISTVNGVAVHENGTVVS